MQRQNIRERHLPQIVKPDQDVFQGQGEVGDLGVGQVGQAGVRGFRRDIHFVGVAGEIGQERDGGVVLIQEPGPVGPLGRDDVSEQRPAMFVADIRG